MVIQPWAEEESSREMRLQSLSSQLHYVVLGYLYTVTINKLYADSNSALTYVKPVMQDQFAD